MAKADPRPLSPHLDIWKFTVTMAGSITHRATGVAMYAGTVLLAVWLAAAAAGPETYAMAQGFFGSPIGLVILFGYTWALLFHLLNGLRYLFWDTGRGFDLETAGQTGLAAYILSIVVTIAVWAIAFLA